MANTRNSLECNEDGVFGRDRYLVERLIEEGVLESYVEVARLLGISRARLNQIASLRWLAPGVQEGILGGKGKTTLP